MITPKELATMVLRHNKGGNGWVMVRDHGDDYCHVSLLLKDGKIDSQAFLAWKPCLAVDQLCVEPETRETPAKYAPYPIPANTTAKLGKLRTALATGKLAIQNTRFVPQS